MKICQIIRRHLTVLGIQPPKSNQLLSFNPRISLGLLSFVCANILSALYLVYSANNILEYMRSVCVVTATTEVGFCFLAFVLQKRRLFDYMETMEKLINKSNFIPETSKKTISNSKCNCFRSGKSNIKSYSCCNRSPSWKDLSNYVRCCR